jgi:hypothetical protein
MGRTLPSATQVFIEEERYYNRFKRALSPPDQRALEELFDFAHWHIAEAGYAAHPMPMQIYLLAMMLEEQKKVRSLREIIEQLQRGEKPELPESLTPPGSMF